MQTCKITRYVKEEYEVDAETREEALLNAYNPAKVIITREVCTKKK